MSDKQEFWYRNRTTDIVTTALEKRVLNRAEVSTDTFPYAIMRRCPPFVFGQLVALVPTELDACVMVDLLNREIDTLTKGY